MIVEMIYIDLPHSSIQSFNVSKLFLFPPQPLYVNGSQRPDNSLKKNREVDPWQRPYNAGSLQISEGEQTSITILQRQ